MDHPTPEDIASLIHRHEAGERSPELLTALDRAAFVFFHAPWEKAPAKLPRLTLGRLPLDDEDPDRVRAARYALLQALHRLGWAPFVREIHQFLVLMPFDPGAGCEFQLHLHVEGDEPICQGRARGGTLYSPEEVDMLRVLVRRWNEDRPFRQAWLHQPAPGAPRQLEYRFALDMEALKKKGELDAALEGQTENLRKLFRFVRGGLDEEV